MDPTGPWFPDAGVRSRGIQRAIRDRFGDNAQYDIGRARIAHEMGRPPAAEDDIGLLGASLGR
jgi:hypothetical protein